MSAQYSRAKTTDDYGDDEEESPRRSSSSHQPPPTCYRDDPTQSYRDYPSPTPASDTNDDDVEKGSIFDWGGSSAGPNRDKKSPSFDPELEIPFTPISLHDEDSEGPHCDRRHQYSDRLDGDNHYDLIDSYHEGEAAGQRLFVGGGWGRHGSTTDYYRWMCPCFRQLQRYGSNNSNHFWRSSSGCLFIGFVTLSLLSGLFGYEAGLPLITTDDDGTAIDNNDPPHPNTHGEQWLEWLETEKEKLHLPHFQLNFTKRQHQPTIKNNQIISFPPMKQDQLLALSTNIFQSCSEHSISTPQGRLACLSLCHGHYCCFEKEIIFGSCVTMPNSYCFVYAACENVIMDFGFDNVNAGEMNNLMVVGPTSSEGSSSSSKYALNQMDIQLLSDTCSTENVGTLEGIRDCNAFCQHHLCCFSNDANENCAMEFREECEAYSPCGVIATGPGNNGHPTASEQIEKAVYDACYFGDDETKVTPGLVAKCHNICAPRYCCFESQTMVSSCLDSVGEEECKLYSLCEEMINDRGDEVRDFIELDKLRFDDNDGGGSDSVTYTPGGITSSSTAEQIEEAVYDACYFGDDETKVTPGLVAKCHNICAPRYCCFESQTMVSSCLDSVGEEECKLYSLCEEMINDRGDEVRDFIELDKLRFDDNDGGGYDSVTYTPGGITSSSTAEQIEKAVYDACYFGDDETKVTPGLVAKCHNICAPRYCCFESQTIVSSCLDSVGEEECKLYSLCEEMINDRGDEVRDFIELDKLEFDSDGRQSVINSGNMIVSNPGNKFNGGFIDENEFKATVNAVNAACEPKADVWGDDNSWVNGCHSMCADYLCCFSTDGTESNCKDVYGNEVCEAYAGCKVLSSSTTSSSFSSSQQTDDQITLRVQLDEIKEACVPKIRRDANLLERCRNVCEPRSCCWKSGLGNCYQMNTDWCEEFGMCEILVV